MYTDKVKHYNLPPAVLMDLFDEPIIFNARLSKRCVINAIVILLLTFILYIQHVIKFNPLPKRWLHVVNTMVVNTILPNNSSFLRMNQIFFDEILSGRNSKDTRDIL